MVRLGRHKYRSPKLQLWQHKANIMAHIGHARLWFIETKAEVLDAWHTYRTNK
jgi:hypothetical protein